MNNRNDILDYLKISESENINIINFIESYPIHYMERIGGSVLVKGTSDRKWVYISSKSTEELEIIKEKLDDADKNFAIIEDWMIPILTRGSNIKWKLSTMRLILPGNIDIPQPACKTEELIPDDADFIYESSDYKEYLSVEYIRERITNGISSCIRIIDKPIAWGITQDDGAMGFLHVLPEHRRMGYGRDVTLDLIHKVRNSRQIPFVHIEEDNQKSMGLALGLGFQKDRIVNWFEID